MGTAKTNPKLENIAIMTSIVRLRINRLNPRYALGNKADATLFRNRF